MGWKIKSKYKDQKIGLRGFGLLDLSVMSPELIHKLSLRPEYASMIKYIRKYETKSEKFTQKSKSKKANSNNDDISSQ